MASNELAQAQTNRSIRTIKAELAFLTDASVMNNETLSSILAQLPVEQEMHAPIPLSTEPIAQRLGGLSVNGNDYSNEKKNGYTSPAPSDVQQPPPAYPSAPAPPAAVLTYANALYAYKPSDAGDLELQARDRIAVTEYMNAEWWKGRSERTGEEGIFPRSYVEVEKNAAPQMPGRANSSTNYGNMPMDVSQSGGSAPADPAQKSKFEQGGKKFGKKMGNAAIFGAGATIGSNIVNGIF
ncbi:MAG: hypothetical protein Q9162_006330 [Coniocarpon cinnabarinum]